MVCSSRPHQTATPWPPSSPSPLSRGCFIPSRSIRRRITVRRTGIHPSDDDLKPPGGGGVGGSEFYGHPTQHALDLDTGIGANVYRTHLQGLIVVKRRANSRFMIALHPGEVLRKLYLEPLGIDIGEVSERLGMNLWNLSYILGGHRDVTPDVAQRLETTFRASAQS